MLDVSQASSLLQSLGVNATTANQAAARTVEAANSYALNFLQELHDALAAVSSDASPSATAASPSSPTIPSTVDLAQSTGNLNADTTAQDATEGDQDAGTTPPFSSFEEFRQWERGLGKTLAPDYRAPDYLRLIALARQGGEQDAFKRYVFFKNNPQYAHDYEAICDGQLSKFPTDGSSLIKTDLSKLPAEVADYYRKNPATLRAVEGFAMDPTLYKMRMDGDIQGMGDPSWLMTHSWTPDGIVESNNGYLSTLTPFIGMDGKGADNYRLATYSDGLLVDVDGQRYDPITGQAQA